MDQIKIGMFIADLRKERGMTQKQLAENVGVSDKTISKWECGNGLPEMSSIPVLCEALGINMNELLSGERLAEEAYSRKAEENMMTLMQETEKHKKNSKRSGITLIVCLLGVVATLIFAMSFGIGYSTLMNFFDFTSLIMLLLPTFFVLAAAGLLKSFFAAFFLFGKKGAHCTEQQKSERKLALRLGAVSFLAVGIIETLGTIIYLMGSYMGTLSTEIFSANVAVASLSLLYGLTLYILLLPIRYKLEKDR